MTMTFVSKFSGVWWSFPNILPSLDSEDIYTGVWNNCKLGGLEDPFLEVWQQW